MPLNLRTAESLLNLRPPYSRQAVEDAYNKAVRKARAGAGISEKKRDRLGQTLADLNEAKRVCTSACHAPSAYSQTPPSPIPQHQRPQQPTPPYPFPNPPPFPQPPPARPSNFSRLFQIPILMRLLLVFQVFLSAAARLLNSIVNISFWMKRKWVIVSVAISVLASLTATVLLNSSTSSGNSQQQHSIPYYPRSESPKTILTFNSTPTSPPTITPKSTPTPTPAPKPTHTPVSAEQPFAYVKILTHPWAKIELRNTQKSLVYYFTAPMRDYQKIQDGAYNMLIYQTHKSLAKKVLIQFHKEVRCEVQIKLDTGEINIIATR